MRAFLIRRLLARPRVCIFCGGPPTDKTREHVIPRWLIEQTGDPNRRILLGPFTSQSLIRGRSDPFKSFSFESFSFPSCRACNARFADLEGRAKPAILALMDARPLSSSDFDVTLDWFDKVRVGLWLAYHYFLDRNYWGVQPHFFIADRLATSDRSLSIRRAQTYEPGIRFAGVNTPAFAHTPSCFSLVINEWFLLNVSSHFLVSKAAGLPYPVVMEFGPDERIRTVLKSGHEELRYPLLDLGSQPAGVVLGQPRIPGPQLMAGGEDLYEGTYLSRITVTANRGKLLVQRDGAVTTLPDDAGTAWVPPTEGAFEEMLRANARETLLLQNALTQRLSLSPALSTEQRRFMETQNTNCIDANNQLLGILDKE